MRDIQNSPDTRGIAIDQVGIRDVSYPIVVLDRSRERQPTVARISMSVNLPREFRGTHMSRFIETLERHRGEVTLRTVPAILTELRQQLQADVARVEVHFPYFFERVAPASGARAVMDYGCRFLGEMRGNDADFRLGVRIPVTSVCPCSKAISDRGAHNQRGVVDICVRPRRTPDGGFEFIWIEELVQLGERSASAPVYPLLKRVDERHVTMQAYDNPVFVEDIVRNVACQLRDDPRVESFEVEAVNHESIHNHSAFARAHGGRWSEDLARARPAEDTARTATTDGERK